MQAAVSDLLQARIEIAGIGLAGEQAPTGGIRGDRVLMSQSIDRHRGVAGQPTLQVCEQTVCRLIAIRRVLAQELVDDRCQQGVAVRRLGVGQRWRLCQVAMQQGKRVVFGGPEGRSAGQHVKQHGPDGIEVCAAIDLGELAATALRRQVGQMVEIQYLVRVGRVRNTRRLVQTEQLHAGRLSDQQHAWVERLECPARAVQRIELPQQCTGDLHGSRWIQWCLRQQVLVTPLCWPCGRVPDQGGHLPEFNQPRMRAGSQHQAQRAFLLQRLLGDIGCGPRSQEFQKVVVVGAVQARIQQAPGCGVRNGVSRLYRIHGVPLTSSTRALRKR